LMEKRKLLLVAVSVGVFLVIVLSAAILIFTPGRTGAVIAQPVPPVEPAAAANPRLPASADAAEMIRNAEDLQGLRVPPPAPPGADTSPHVPGASPSASAVQENNFYFNGENSAQASAAERGDPAQVVINVPKPSAPGVPAPSPRPPARPAQTAAPAPVRPAQPPAQAQPAQTAQTARPIQPAAQPAQPAQPAAQTRSQGAGDQARPGGQADRTAAARPAAAPRTRPRAQQDYWIQTGAFSALVRAEDAKETLASKGLVSIIDDREVDGRIWYRVRVGPYTSENEANYWLALVRAIDGFDQSQVRSSQR
jgi:DedD protein